MKFSKLIEQRYSVRSYQDKPVNQAALDEILDAARMAPTAANRQPVRIIVIETAGREEELKRIYGRDWFVDAPLVLCVCGVAEEGWTRRDDDKSYVDVDAAIVMDHIILAATEHGLGTCWIAAFDPQAAREVLNLPEGVEPIVFTPLGYAASSPRPKKRKTLTDMVKYGSW